jgi:hypothetical protein
MRVTTRLQNKGAKEIGLQVEPDGLHYRIAAGAHVDLIVEGPAAGEPGADPVDAGVLTVRHEPDLVTVYVWGGCEYEVLGAEPCSPWPTDETK